VCAVGIVTPFPVLVTREVERLPFEGHQFPSTLDNPKSPVDGNIGEAFAYARWPSDFELFYHARPSQTDLLLQA